VAQTGADPNALPFHGAANPSAGEFLVSKFAFGEMSRNDLSFTMGDIGDTPGPFKFVTDQSVDSKPDGSVTATSTVYGYDENTGAYSTFYATPQAPLRFWMDENDRLQVTPER